MEATGWTNGGTINTNQYSLNKLHTDVHSHASHFRLSWTCSPGGQEGSSPLSSSIPHCVQLAQPLSQAPVWSQTPAVPLINVRYDPVGCLHHLNGVSTKQLPLIVNELAPEATVGPDDRAAGFDPGVGLSQRHTVILHKVSQTQRGWAAHTRCTVHQHRPSFASHTVDLISHAVEVQGYWRVGHVRQWDLYILHVRPVEVRELDGGVDHTGDAFGQQQAAVGCHVPPAEEEVGGDLRNAPQQAAILRQQPWYRSGDHRATVVVVVVMVEEALAAGTHRGIKWAARRTANCFKKQNLQELRVIVVQRDQPDGSPGTHKQISSKLNIFLFHCGLSIQADKHENEWQDE